MLIDSVGKESAQAEEGRRKDAGKAGAGDGDAGSPGKRRREGERGGGAKPAAAAGEEEEEEEESA